MLRSLEIQNFKGIKQGKLEDLAQVNVLVGRNNSGKSTILDALIMLRCAVVGRDYLGIDGLEQIIRRRVDRGDIDHTELWFKLNSGVPLLFSAQYANGKKLTEIWSSSPQVRISSDDYEIGNFGRNSYSPRDVSNAGYWGEISRAIGAAEVTHLGCIHMLDPNGIHQPMAERLWPELIKDRRDVRVVKMLNEIYRTNIEYLSFMPFPSQTRLVAALPHAGIAVDWLGDGMRYAVNILALGVLLRGTALLVEELETHQHPESLRKLTQTLFELAKQQDLQLFLTTHSMELITYALDAAEEKGIDLKLYHLNLDKEGTLRATPFSQPNAQLMLDIGHDPRLHYKYIGVE
jgi:AAA15 family ATPase/GTPase